MYLQPISVTKTDEIMFLQSSINLSSANSLSYWLYIRISEATLCPAVNKAIRSEYYYSGEEENVLEQYVTFTGVREFILAEVMRKGECEVLYIIGGTGRMG